MQIKNRQGNQLNISELEFDDKLFEIQDMPISASFTTHTTGAYGSSNFNGWRVRIDLKHNYKSDLEWLSQNRYQIQNTMMTVMNSGASILSMADVSVLKQMANTYTNASSSGLDFTNPLVLKAFETFLTVAKLHSEAKIGQ